MFNVFSVPRTTGWRRRKAEALRLETEKAKAQGLPSPTKGKCYIPGGERGCARDTILSVVIF